MLIPSEFISKVLIKIDGLSIDRERHSLFVRGLLQLFDGNRSCKVSLKVDLDMRLPFHNIRCGLGGIEIKGENICIIITLCEYHLTFRWI